MSRRRAQKQQEKEDFLDQNPELIEYETVIRVVENDPHAPQSFSAIGSENGGPEYELSPAFGLDLNTPDAAFENQFLDGPDYLLSSLGKGISLSDAGIGVGSSESQDGFDTIEDGESLNIQMSVDGFGNQFFPGSGTSPTDVGVYGGESLEVDFTASGRGTVQFALRDLETGERTYFETDFIRGRAGNEYEFGVDLPDEDLFSRAEITTTGSLEISIVGITLGTNFESGFDSSGLG